MTADHTHSYLIFDLHRTILCCCLEETLGSSGLQQKRKLAVLALSETMHRAETPPEHHCEDEQPSCTPLFPTEKLHGVNISQNRAI